MKIGNEKFVTLSYNLTVDGQLADMATADNPLGFVFGTGMLLPAFEKQIEGKKAGDKFEFTLTPEEGYGVSNPNMVVELPRETFVIDGKIEDGLLTVGNEVPMMTSDGMRLLGRITAIGENNVTMDFNHPMADRTLDFTGEIIEVREATDDDYPRGGCDCGCGEADCNCDDGDCSCGSDDCDKSGDGSKCGCN